MTPSQTAKALGCQSLAQVSKASGVPIQTLRDWHGSRPWVFEACCMRASDEWRKSLAIHKASN